ncbi:hypothetical protein [Sphingomonas sp. VNH70]|uniref:hypothetical protein n=1 Tax=Sphingomonas silueang TaxID=3156617 RepID=UPI0032B5BC94
MLKKSALAIALAGYVMVGATAASAGQRASASAFPVATAPVKAIAAPAKRRVAKDAELAAGLSLPIIIGGIALISLVIVAASGGSDSSPN